MESHPADTVDDLCQTYLPALMDARRYDDAASLAARGIQLCSSDADTLEILERYRVSAYLRSGRPRQALAAAKSLFNVATMPQTAPAILLVAECLNAANPGDPGPVERFKDQQVAGADPATRPSGPQPSVLAAIAPDSQPADDALRLFYHGGYVIHANQYRELVGRGNLLLLAGRADEARQVFIRALRIADADQLYAARENVARAIKADDGAIGRANAFLIRPDLDP
jgi:tetratricopeptide (TPR) repeat protein